MSLRVYSEVLRRYTGGTRCACTQRVLKGTQGMLKRGRVLVRDVSKVRIGYSAGIQRVLSGYSAVITQRVPKRVPSRYSGGTPYSLGPGAVRAVEWHRVPATRDESEGLENSPILPKILVVSYAVAGAVCMLHTHCRDSGYNARILGGELIARIHGE